MYIPNVKKKSKIGITVLTGLFCFLERVLENMSKINYIFKRYTSILPYLFLIILPFILFYKIFSGNIILVGDFTGSDLIDLHLPFKQILHNNFTQGKVPLWESKLSMGFPTLAEGQSGVFYPPNYILSFLPPTDALNLSVILAFAFAAIFTFIYVRSLGYGIFSSLVSSIAFSFSAFFVARVKHLNIITVSSWLPFVFWSIRKTFRKKDYLYLYLGVFGITMQFLAGHPQMTYYSIFIYLIYWVFEFFESLRSEKLKKIFPFALKILIILIIVPLLLSAVQILPTLEFAGLSQRTGFSIKEANQYPFTPKSLFTFIFPYFFGNPAVGTYSEDIRVGGIFWENNLYIGILPIIFAIFSSISVLRKRKKEWFSFRFFVLLSLLSFILMLGSSTPFYNLLWKFLPGFSLFRFPVRFNLFLIFSLSILAGFGAERISYKLIQLKFENKKKNSEKFSISWPFKIFQTKTLILILIICDLFLFANSYISYISKKDLLKTPEIISELQRDKSLYRIISFSQYGESPYAIRGWKYNQKAILNERKAIPPNNNVLYGLYSFNDRGWFEGGLSLRNRNKIENYLLNDKSNDYTGKILGMYNVKYAITYSDSLGKDMKNILEYDSGNPYILSLKLYENTRVLPRVFFVPDAKIVQNENDFLDTIKADSFDPETTVILNKKPLEIGVNGYGGDISNFKKDNSTIVTNYQDTEVQITADLKNSGFLILNDVDYPGWRVQVDGIDKEILNANFIVRAVELTSGKHFVRFYYDPLSFKIGLIISLISFFVLFFLLMRKIKSKIS
jgi:hypothetical protein